MMMRLKLKARVLLVLIAGILFLVLLKVGNKKDVKYTNTLDKYIRNVNIHGPGHFKHNGNEALHKASQSNMHLNSKSVIPKNPNFDIKIANSLIEKYKFDLNYKLTSSPWKLAASWVGARQIHPDNVPELGAILRSMSSGKILSADVGYKGTQLKLSLTLEGGQRVAFKPKWFDRDFVILGKPYDGADRHNGEIAAFHLNRLLGYNKSPLVTGRVVNLKTEIIPVASKELLKTFFTKDNNTCFYGKCMYCKSEEDGVCGDGVVMEGAVVLWMPEKWSRFQRHRSPWQRTYVDGKQARWEYSSDYCDSVLSNPTYASGPRLADLIDAHILDYLIGNADRHHYEVFQHYKESMIILLDNAKSFGNYFYDERSVMAPLYQCCKVRKTTYDRLLLLKNGVLSYVLREILSADSISPVLHEAHLEAMDRRLEAIAKEIEKCVQNHSASKVFWEK